MPITGPNFVMLDTGTFVQMVTNPQDRHVRELAGILRVGEWVPFVTWHHIEELVSHENNDEFQRRLGFLNDLPHVAFLKQRTEGPDIGSVVDVRDYEITFVAAHPGASFDEVIQGVSPQVRSGFCTGRQLLAHNVEWWSFFRRFLAEDTRLRKEEVANITHFPTTDLKRRLPEPGNCPPARSAEKSVKHFNRMAQKLSRQISANGDCRAVDPQAAAFKLMREAYQDSLPLIAHGGDFIDGMMKRDGVERSRLPKHPTVEDMGFEVVFVAQMGVHARRLLRGKDELLRLVRKEQVPAWMIWQEVDRRIKSLPHAEIGNVNDKHMLGFSSYVEVMNVDKRIAELLRQAACDHQLLKKVYERVPRGRGLQGLVERLRKV